MKIFHAFGASSLLFVEIKTFPFIKRLIKYEMITIHRVSSLKSNLTRQNNKLSSPEINLNLVKRPFKKASALSIKP